MSISKTGNWLGRLCAALLSASAAQADPCPIDFGVYDLGSPAGIDNIEVLASLQVQSGWLAMSWRFVDGGMRVVGPVEGGPAEQAGLVNGTVITAIDGVPTTARDETSDRMSGLRPLETLRLDVTLRNGPSQTIDVTTTYQDPLHLLVADTLRAQSCRDAHLRTTEEFLKDALRAAAVTANGALRCDDAHFAILETNIRLGPAPLLILRGRDQTLLTLPGWATRCLPHSALDGDALTPETTLSILEPLLFEYVGEQFSTP